MPQTENGFTQIANELIEQFARIRIPGEAMQVFWVMLRKIYGFHKKSDPIALSQIVAATGLSKIAVCKAVKKLIELNLITKKGNKIAAEYAINKHFDTWKPLPKKVTLPKKVMAVTQKGNLPLPKKYTTKETITKETITKERKKEYPAEKSNDISGEKSLKEQKPNAWAIWIDVNREFGRVEPFSSGKDTRAAKNILAQIKDPEKYADILRQFLADDDKFLMQNGHSISFLTSKINKYLNQCYKPKISDSYSLSDDQIAEIYANEEKFAADES
jgi:phage replication O-like protein O